MKIQTLGGILDLKISKHYANCPGSQEKIWEQDLARADLNFLMHVSQSETDHFYYPFLTFHLQFVDS